MNIICRLKELEAKATPGPWTDSEDNKCHMVDGTIRGCVTHIARSFVSQTDAQLIAEMRNALPKLLAVIGAARVVFMNNQNCIGLRDLENTFNVLDGVSCEVE